MNEKSKMNFCRDERKMVFLFFPVERWIEEELKEALAYYSSGR
jgi:hypothetical protein